MPAASPGWLHAVLWCLFAMCCFYSFLCACVCVLVLCVATVWLWLCFCQWRRRRPNLCMFSKQNEYFPTEARSLCANTERLQPSAVWRPKSCVLQRGLIQLEWWVFEALATLGYLGCGLRCNTALFESNNAILQSVQLLQFPLPSSKRRPVLSRDSNCRSLSPLKEKGQKLRVAALLTSFGRWDSFDLFVILVNAAVLPNCTSVLLVI